MELEYHFEPKMKSKSKAMTPIPMAANTGVRNLFPKKQITETTFAVTPIPFE